MIRYLYIYNKVFFTLGKVYWIGIRCLKSLVSAIVKENSQNHMFYSHIVAL